MQVHRYSEAIMQVLRYSEAIMQVHRYNDIYIPKYQNKIYIVKQ